MRSISTNLIQLQSTERNNRDVKANRRMDMLSKLFEKCRRLPYQSNYRKKFPLLLMPMVHHFRRSMIDSCGTQNHRFQQGTQEDRCIHNIETRVQIQPQLVFLLQERPTITQLATQWCSMKTQGVK